MKIREVVELIGAIEPIRILNRNLDEVACTIEKNLTEKILDENVRTLYADKSVVCIVIK